MTYKLLLSLLGITVMGVIADHCPAKPNSEEMATVRSARRSKLALLERDYQTHCQDKNPHCAHCLSTCTNSTYNMWLLKNCPLTCGFCEDDHDHDGDGEQDHDHKDHKNHNDHDDHDHDTVMDLESKIIITKTKQIMMTMHYDENGEEDHDNKDHKDHDDHDHDRDGEQDHDHKDHKDHNDHDHDGDGEEDHDHDDHKDDHDKPCVWGLIEDMKIAGQPLKINVTMEVAKKECHLDDRCTAITCDPAGSCSVMKKSHKQRRRKGFKTYLRNPVALQKKFMNVLRLIFPHLS